MFSAKKSLIGVIIISLIVISVFSMISINAAKAGYTNGVSLSGSTATIWYKSKVNTTWVNIHYKVANSGQQDFKMKVANGRFEHSIASPIKKDTVIEYYFTYRNGSKIYTSPWYKYKVGPIKPVPGSYQVVWADEFNGSSLNQSNWVYDIGGNGWGNNELQYYTNSSKNSSVSNGALTITARKEALNGKNYTSARIKTQGKQQFSYGRICARIKLPVGKGIWPAFWMLGSNINTVSWPKCGEIDIMEHVNKETKAVGTMHWDANGHKQYGNSTNCDVTKYHLYTIDWTPTSIKWFIDGQKYHEANIANGINGTEEFQKPFFIILNMAIGGNWPGSPDGSTVLPAQMQVDYVRVYQKTPGSPSNNPTIAPTIAPTVAPTGSKPTSTPAPSQGKNSIYAIPASSIPNPSGNGVMSVRVLNGTNGAYPDNKVYWGVLGINPANGKWSYLDLDGNLKPISDALNNAPGHLTKNGQNYANIYHTVAQKSWVSLPKITSGRMFLSTGSPCYIKTYNDGFAGPSLDNASDPNKDIYYDFVEFTVDNTGYHGNTTRVDGFGFPIQHRLINKSGNYDKTVGEFESETRSGIFTKYKNEVPEQFKSLGTVQAPYRIIAPIHGSFAKGGANANYFAGYSNISTQDILMGVKGAADPKVCADLNRHVTGTSNSNNPSAYYKASPANYYSKFWHDHSIDKLAYGFCYDDYNQQAAYLEITDPKGLLIRVGW